MRSLKRILAGEIRYQSNLPSSIRAKFQKYSEDLDDIWLNEKYS